MKNLLKKISLFSIIALVFTSCENDDNIGKSTLNVNSDVQGTIAPVGTYQFNTPITVNEGDEPTFDYTVTLDKTQSVDIHVKVKVLNGSATADDVEIEDLVIPANTLSATGQIKVKKDATIEQTESLTIQIGGDNVANANIPAKLLTLNIENYLSNVLSLSMSYDTSFTVNGVNYSLCDLGYDIDFYLLDSALNDTGITQAATGNCPEHMDIDISTLADGDYYVYYDLFDSVNVPSLFSTPADVFPINITIEYNRDGGIDPATVVRSPFDSNLASGSGALIAITVENGKFTINGTTGRLSNFQVKKLKN